MSSRATPGLKMKTTFAVDGVRYVIEFTERNEFIFYVDAVKSDRIVYRMSAFERGFGDAPPDTVWTVTDQAIKHIFEIRRQVEDFLDRAIRRFRPYYFVFSANEDSKRPLYRRLARRLATKHGYHLTVDEAVFRFVRHSGAASSPTRSRRSWSTGCGVEAGRSE